MVAKSQENWSKPVEAASYCAKQKWIKIFESIVVKYIWSSSVKLLKYMVFPKNLINIFFIKLIISVTTYFFVKLISMKKIMQCLQQTCGNVPPNFHEKFLWFTLYRQRGSTSLIFCMSTFVRCLHKVEIIYPKPRGKKITMQRKYLCLIIPMWGLEL